MTAVLARRRIAALAVVLAVLILPAGGCGNGSVREADSSLDQARPRDDAPADASLGKRQIEVTMIASRDMEVNTYVVHIRGRSDCVLVDVGPQPDRLVQHLQKAGLRPVAILVTHGHADHIAGIGAIRRRWPECKIAIGERDAAMLTDSKLNLSAAWPFQVVSPPADHRLSDGGTFAAAGLQFAARAVPGHSPGHMAYALKDHDPVTAFVGDAIFAGSIGRTDFGGDQTQLVAAIRAKLLTLPETARLLPGHGPGTTVGEEKRANPFVGQRAAKPL